MRQLRDELLDNLIGRLSSLEAHAEGLSGARPINDVAGRSALNAVTRYVKLRRDEISKLWGASSPETQLDSVRTWLLDLDETTRLVEAWFYPEATDDVPHGLVRAVEDECQRVRVGSPLAWLVVGPPNNFEMRVSDFVAEVFSSFSTRVQNRERAEYGDFVMLRVPRLEGLNSLWRPVVLGHEVAHLAVRRHDVVANAKLLEGFPEYPEEELADRPLSVPESTYATNPQGALRSTAGHWFEELLCDGYALKRFGPAAVISLGRFLESVGATDDVDTHPPAWLRVQIMLNQLGHIRSPRLRSMLEPWHQVSPGTALPSWAPRLIAFVKGVTDKIYSAVEEIGAHAYVAEARSDVIEALADDFEKGLPRAHVKLPGVAEPSLLLDADIVVAGWLAQVEGSSSLQTLHRSHEEISRFSRLVSHALEARDFMAVWSDVEAQLREEGRLQPKPPKPHRVGRLRARLDLGGTLSDRALATRLNSGQENQIFASPEMPDSVSGAALDLRLGSTFIAFKRSSVGWYDPLGEVTSPRLIQHRVEKSWGESFVLHPNELVLANALEYISLPGDLVGQVVTRSSYGRLGLITATAVLVHPHFQGCLTLELVNLGEIPIRLYPGERIAQLSFQKVRPKAFPREADKYSTPTRPQFSRVRSDRDADILRAIRARYGVERGDIT